MTPFNPILANAGSYRRVGKTMEITLEVQNDINRYPLEHLIVKEVEFLGFSVVGSPRWKRQEDSTLPGVSLIDAVCEIKGWETQTIISDELKDEEVPAEKRKVKIFITGDSADAEKDLQDFLNSEGVGELLSLTQSEGLEDGTYWITHTVVYREIK